MKGFWAHLLLITLFVTGSLAWAHEPLLTADKGVVEEDAFRYSGPLFDAHLHFAEEEAQIFSALEIEAIFERNQVVRAVVSSTPTAGTEQLYQAMPERVIPFYSFYQGFHDKARWAEDESVVVATERALKSGFYRGVGELHLFKEQVESPVFAQVVGLAKQYRLPLQVHGDLAVVDKVFALYPQAKVIWAHLGTQPEPDFLRAALVRYPQGLFIDTSVRDGLLWQNGAMPAQWYDLFVDYPDRFMAAVDTYSVYRWQNFDQVVQQMRTWLGALPPKVAQRIAYQNADDFFATTELNNRE
ncbi:MAG: amidohydrolase [Thiotrichales bacterium]|nr:amidohydrolase [Thiotrichales bacterium]